MKRFIRVAMLLGVMAVLLSALSLNTMGAKATTLSGKVLRNRFSSTSCGKWNVVPSPNGNGNSGLSGVTVVSTNDVWAVGSSGSQLGGGQSLTEHWDGVHWQTVPSPNPSSRYNPLFAVAAVSASDIWAVGYYVSPSQSTQTLIEHWSGSQWSVVKSPSPGSINNQLFSVAAVSASDVWAVGLSSTNTAQQTLIEHWNGSQWSVVKSPSPGSGSPSDLLSGVAAVSANDVWAVGTSSTFGKTLVEHWNGLQWSVVKSPSPGTGDELRQVTVVSASDIWAVGYTFNGSIIQTLVERWNGTSWQIVKSANVGSSPDLIGVVAISANDVWAVGSDTNSNNVIQTLIEHWNGSQWTVVKSPSPGSFSSQLLAVAAVSASDVWAVGYANGNTLVERDHC